jgi:hypothetical protein
MKTSSFDLQNVAIKTPSKFRKWLGSPLAVVAHYAYARITRDRPVCVRWGPADFVQRFGTTHAVVAR